MREKELAAKIEAVNKAHAYANQLWKQLTEFFRPYVGTTILRKDGQFMAKMPKLPEFPNTLGLMVYRHISDYSLAWTVKTSECYPKGERYQTAVYYEVTIYIGDLQGQELTKLCESYQEPPALCTDYTLEAVQVAREAAKQAKKAYDAAQSKCWPFGE